jgi:hypothetical protein
MSEYWKLKIEKFECWKLKTEMFEYRKLKTGMSEYWKLKTGMSEYLKLKNVWILKIENWNVWYKSFEVVPHKALIVSRYLVHKHSCNLLLHASRIYHTHNQKNINHVSKSIINKQSTPKKNHPTLSSCQKNYNFTRSKKGEKKSNDNFTNSFFFFSKISFQQVF